MKQFIVGILVGASLSGTVALAVNPIGHLPVQEQLDRIVDAADAQFNNISAALDLAQTFFTDIGNRLTVIETKLKIKRDE